MQVVFDIGGTNMRVARSDKGVLGDILKVSTPKDPQEAAAQFAELARKAAGGTVTSALGGVRGTILDGVFTYDKILPAWEGVRLSAVFAEALGARVEFFHDTSLAGLGEVHRGAGRDSAICAYVTVSTGVGGDRIVDGRLDRSTVNPEIGRQLVSGEQLEDLVSGTAVERKFGLHPRDLASQEERDKLADTLAVGLYNTVLHWTPDRVVLGGSMILGANPIPFARIETALSELLAAHPKPPAVKKAALGDAAGLEGACIAALQDVSK